MHGAHSPDKVTFLGESGAVLAESDYIDQSRYLSLVRNSRQTPISKHWEYLLQPMQPAYAAPAPGARAGLRYTQLENKRIPAMSYLTFDDPRVLSRGDMVRIGFATKWGDSGTLPFAEPFLVDFERENCYDRYWFHEISNQVQASDFFKYWSRELDSVALYAEVREEARDINEYLDADRMRKQTDNAMRLTVVSSCGMVGTVATGFLGMNLYSHSDLPISYKVIIFLFVFVPTAMLALYTVVISKRLANFMESMASEGLT